MSPPPGGGAATVLTPGQTRSLIFILGTLTAFGPLSIDMYLPSMPALAADLDAPTTRVQMTLSSYFIGGAPIPAMLGKAGVFPDVAKAA